MAHLVFQDSSSSDLLRRTQKPKTNMKFFIVLAALVAVALAAPPRRHQAAPRALYAEPSPAASELSPPVALYAEPNVAANEIVLTKEIPSDNMVLDTYRFAFEQSDGQKREETAKVEVASDPEESILRVQGSYSFVGDDGKTYTVNYIADENGFQPQGEHLPVAPVA